MYISTKYQPVLDGAEAFRREVRVLKRYSHPTLSHAHLITLLATYKYRERFHLIFPLAEWDLLGYWKNEKPKHKIPNYDTVKWLARQCAGIAEGLYKIHRHDTASNSSLLSGTNIAAVPTLPVPGRSRDYSLACPTVAFGHHGDIKPSNLLWFPEQKKSDRESGQSGFGTIKIADFGFSKFSRDENGSTIRGIPNSPTYRPPEYEFPNERICCAYDIWTLGCLFLEFVAWYFGGWKLVSKFAVMRKDGDEYPVHRFPEDTFFTLVDPKESKAKVKTAVTKVCEVSFHF